MSVQEAIRELRARLGLSQEGLARRMDLTLRTIARYENDSPPTAYALKRFGELAREEGQPELSDIFFRAIAEELGLIKHWQSVLQKEALAFDRVLRMVTSELSDKKKRQECVRWPSMLGKIQAQFADDEFFRTLLEDQKLLLAVDKRISQPETDEEEGWVQKILFLIRNKDQIPSCSKILNAISDDLSNLRVGNDFDINYFTQWAAWKEYVARMAEKKDCDLYPHSDEPSEPSHWLQIIKDESGKD
jgi:transcriptional regulator with XRE-family HTH domain